MGVLLKENKTYLGLVLLGFLSNVILDVLLDFLSNVNLDVLLSLLLDIVIIIIRKSSVLRQSLDLRLEEFHILRKTRHDGSALFTRDQTLVAALLSTLVVAVVGQPNKEEEQDNDNEGSQNSQSLGVLGEEVRNSKEEQGNKEEHHNDVDKRESTPDASGLSELAGGVKRNSTHDRDRVPDDDTRYVEEQVSKRDLKGVSGGQQGGEKSGNGGTDVGSKSQRKHLFKTQNTDSDKRSQGGGSDRGRLNKHGNTDTDKDGEVSVEVGGLVNDTGGGSQKHLLKDVDQSEEANEKDSQSNDENNTSGGLVGTRSGINLEEGWNFHEVRK